MSTSTNNASVTTAKVVALANVILLTMPARAPRKPLAPTVDNLADQLASVTISTKPKSRPKSDDEVKAAAMRAVNTASQSMTQLLQAKQSRKTLVVEAGKASEMAESNLKTLRKLAPSLDVERAAASVLGKLVSLELVRYFPYRFHPLTPSSLIWL